MPKTALTLAFLILIWGLCFFGSDYFEGLAFDKVYTMVLISGTIYLMPFLALGYIVALVATLVLVLRKKIKFGQLLLPAIIPLLVFVIPLLPLSGFTDGLHDAVNKKLERDKLIEFAEQAKVVADVGDIKRRPVTLFRRHPLDTESLAQFDTLKDVYPEALSMSQLPPRVDVSSDEVRVFYGSALVKHWGYAIVDDDTCPLDRLSASNCQRVYENIWVYSDIY